MTYPDKAIMCMSQHTHTHTRTHPHARMHTRTQMHTRAPARSATPSALISTPVQGGLPLQAATLAAQQARAQPTHAQPHATDAPPSSSTELWKSTRKARAQQKAVAAQQRRSPSPFPQHQQPSPPSPYVVASSAAAPAQHMPPGRPVAAHSGEASREAGCAVLCV